MRHYPKFVDKNRQLAVVTTITSWDELPRFRHQVTRQLARFYNVLYVERTPVNLCKNRYLNRYEQINDHLVLYRPPQIPHILLRFYGRIPFFHTIIDWITRKKIEGAVKKAGYSDAILINFQFDFSAIMSSRIFYPKVYLCNDEFPNQAPRQWQRKLFSEYENQVIKRSDCCFVHSKPLFEKFLTRHKNVSIMLPGHEFNLDKSPEPSNLQRHKKKQISVCYMGYIDKRILLEWLLEVVSHESLFLYLIGPVKNSIDISPLFEFSNFEMIAPLEGEALQSALQSMDVCIIPFDIKQEVVKACTPNKLFQYIACGKPVVISNMDHLIELPDKFIYVANSAKEFVDCIVKANNEDCNELTTQRIELAQENSWDARGEQLHLILESYTKG
jgi:glycosyltransferase involved in cell wall biosynthesis